MAFPTNFEEVIDSAWDKAQHVHGYLGEAEFRALGMLAAGAPAEGVTVEIGSFKGKSTVALASVASQCGFGPVVSIDPHNAPSVTDPPLQSETSSYEAFRTTLKETDIEPFVEVNRATSRDVARTWNRPIRLLWIDGDHTYAGARADFDAFRPYLVDGALVALHDTLHEFDGPIRLFVEEILDCDDFGPAGFLHTIGWAQYRPGDGSAFRSSRKKLARSASRLLPYVCSDRSLRGLRKLRYKLARARVPHRVLPPAEWIALLA